MKTIKIYLTIAKNLFILMTITLISTTSLFAQVVAKSIVPNIVVSSDSNSEFAVIRYENNKGQNGGNLPANIWKTRPLNVIQVAGATTNSGVTEWVKLEDNDRFTLKQGSYIINATAIAYSANSHKIRLRDVTNNKTPIIGLSKFAYAHGAPGNTWVDNSSVLSGIINVSSTSQFELQHISTRDHGAAALGVSFSGPGEDTEKDVYTIIEILRVAEN